MANMIDSPKDYIGQIAFKALPGLDGTQKIKAQMSLMKSFVQVQENLTQPTKDKDGYGYKYADLNGVVDSIQKASKGIDIAFIQQPVVAGGRTGAHNYLINSLGAIFDFGSYLLDIAGSKPQQYGAALTYARRYSISCIFGIASEEDDDAQQFNSKPEFMTPKQLQGMTINYKGKRKDLTEVFAKALNGDELAREIIKDKDNSVNTKLAIKSINAIYEFSLRLNDQEKKVVQRKKKIDKTPEPVSKIKKTIGKKAETKIKAVEDPFAAAMKEAGE